MCISPTRVSFVCLLASVFKCRISPTRVSTPRFSGSRPIYKRSLKKINIINILFLTHWHTLTSIPMHARQRQHTDKKHHFMNAIHTLFQHEDWKAHTITHLCIYIYTLTQLTENKQICVQTVQTSSVRYYDFCETFSKHWIAVWGWGKQQVVSIVNSIQILYIFIDSVPSGTVHLFSLPTRL